MKFFLEVLESAADPGAASPLGRRPRPCSPSQVRDDVCYIGSICVELMRGKFEVHVTFDKKLLTASNLPRVMLGGDQAKSWSGVGESGNGRKLRCGRFRSLGSGGSDELLDLVDDPKLSGHGSREFVLIPQDLLLLG